MASAEAVKDIENKAKLLGALNTSHLRSRAEWGKFSFDDADDDLNRIFTIVGHLTALPLKFLPEAAATQIAAHLEQTYTPVKALDDFDIGFDGASAQRDARSKAISATADRLYTQVTPWIPFLAYQQGDVAKNLANLTRAVDDGLALVERAREAIDVRSREMDSIIEKAREASASAGAAVFTRDFAAKSTHQESSAKSWLIATGVMGGVSLLAGAAGMVLAYQFKPTSLLQTGPMFFMLALLLTATLWVGRVYKALAHQAALNSHRALALQTFQAFVAAASDEQTKNAVLLEAAHSIFGPSSTGFLGAESPTDAGMKIVEILKSSKGDS